MTNDKAQMTKVKICGITNLEDAVEACERGADLLGFIFIGGTPRAVDSGTAKGVIDGLGRHRESVSTVGLFKDEEIDVVAGTVAECGLDLVQLHGGEKPAYCSELKKTLEEKDHPRVKIIKVFKVGDDILPVGAYIPDDYMDAEFFVFDTYHPEVAGGSGERFDWEVLAREKEKIRKPFFIAGGLAPENVAEAVSAVRPYGVDVSSGVEKAPGKKDKDKIKEFIENAKKA